jgi:hypothetical protein
MNRPDGNESELLALPLGTYPGERLCTTRIAFHANYSFGDIRTLSRRAYRLCQEFPDNIACQILDGTKPSLVFAISIRLLGT